MQHRHRELRRHTHLIKIPVGSDSMTGLHSVICMCVSGCVCVFVHKDVHIWRQVQHSNQGEFFFFKNKRENILVLQPSSNTVTSDVFHKGPLVNPLFQISCSFFGSECLQNVSSFFFFFFLCEKRFPERKRIMWWGVQTGIGLTLRWCFWWWSKGAVPWWWVSYECLFPLSWGEMCPYFS